MRKTNPIAIKPVNHLGTGLVVGAHHLAQVFRIQVLRQRSGVHQVTEQHGEVPAFRLGRQEGGWRRHNGSWRDSRNQWLHQ
jgi:hypothetical protein